MDTNGNSMQERVSYTEEERRELIEEFHSSGMKQASFCREWNINPKTLARWLRLERQQKEVSFCEVELGDRLLQADGVRVCLPNGIAVAVPVASTEQLGRVLKEAAGCLD